MDELLAGAARFALAHPDILFQGLSAVVLCAVVIGAALEFVFPPFFGDTLILLGFFTAGRGVVGGWWIFAAALAGSVIGASAAYEMGRRMESLPLGADRLLTPRRLARLESWFGRHGAKVLVANRFLPGIRALFHPMAGMGRMPFRRMLLWSVVGSVLWCGFLMNLGAGAERSWDELARSARGTIQTAGWIALAASGPIALGLWARGRSRRRRGLDTALGGSASGDGALLGGPSASPDPAEA